MTIKASKIHVDSRKNREGALHEWNIPTWEYMICAVSDQGRYINQSMLLNNQALLKLYQCSIISQN